MKKVRYTIDFSEKGAKHFDSLLNRSGLQSKAEVIRNALRLYSFCVNQADEGFITIFTRKGETVKMPVSKW